MRKVIFKDINDKTKKLMIYQAKREVFLFVYNSLEDTSCNWDYWFATLEEADECCQEEYNIAPEEWITIAEPHQHCQHDIISPTRLKGIDIGQIEIGQLQTLIEGNWVDYKPKTCLSFEELSHTDRLLVSGLAHDFKRSIHDDKPNALKILKALKFDSQSIENMLGA